MNRIYLDYASSTPMLPDVKQAMGEVLERWGNPSSIHAVGREAKQALERARRQVAALINARPEEIYFTSCGTESNNWAIRGLLAANKRKAPPDVLRTAKQIEAGGTPAPPITDGVADRRAGGTHLVISAIEHPSVSLVARRLEREGAYITTLSVDQEGVVSPADLKAALTPETVVVSIMLANGEVGTIEPIKELAAVAHEQGALFHTDAVAAVGHLAVDVRALGVDALSLAANQFYGPSGAAALFVREGVRILPLLEGGGQEHGGRSGTESVPAIVGMGMAAEVAAQQLPARAAQLGRLRDRLRDGLRERVESLRFHGSWSSRLPHNLHVCVDGVSSESLVLALDQAGIEAGLGSACNSKAMRPSHVLKAMGLSDEQANGALVLNVGVPTTAEDIDRALDVIPTVVQRLRRVTALTMRTL